ncbi:PP2C family protein-serine/threonine phosphatase [Cellulomonas carbonis]|uniref:Serine/threonine protein phosphatase n=1 Tax=Cellulomonas carbonis T26 TaxID=947969 RepID=A0A0A0BUN2_9CELL|nr:protein phosphatase 2C domain-containing protein [Cellulomonas carbonis]KGM11402.1 serine/threonine protein phosphatase [Cellulomonas carbonis T26]
MRTSWGSATDRGRVRALNEDALLAYPPVFLVADGMGGHDAGDVASRLAVEEFSQLAGRTTATADEIHACFHRVADRLRATVARGRTAGTTVAGVAIVPDDGGSYWLVFNIGDSRVYRLADGVLEQISVDHSVVQELLDAGQIDASAAAAHPDRHVITRAVGTGPDPEPDYWLIPAAPADRVLVCSDGLTSEVPDAVIGRLLHDVVDPQEAAQRLVDAALEAGGRDNVTVVVVDVAAVRGQSDRDRTTRPPGHPDADELAPPATAPPATASPVPAPPAAVVAAPAPPSSPPVLTPAPGVAPVAAPRGDAPVHPQVPADRDTWDEVLDGATVPRPTRRRPPEVSP